MGWVTGQRFWPIPVERPIEEKRADSLRERVERAKSAPPVSDDLRAEIAALKRRVAELELRTVGSVRYGR